VNKLARPASGAVLALVLALVAAAPAAAGTPPTRTVAGLGGWTLPAGTACADFDVAAEPTGGFIATTTFPDGTRQLSVRARGAYVNVTTGKRYQTLDTFRDDGRYDPVTNITIAVETGQTTWSFLPGDVGPFGVVGEGGALYHFIGSVSFTFDSNAGHSTQFAWTGRVEDVCAALS
jgi:hypothetical protein